MINQNQDIYNGYINIDTNEYPCFEGDIRLVHPEISEEFIVPPCFERVVRVEMPLSEDLDFKYTQVAPKKIDEIWYQQWEKVELTQKEKHMRDTKPTDSDQIYFWIEEENKWISEGEFATLLAEERLKTAQ